MPENYERSTATPPKSILGGSTFAQRREDIFKKLIDLSEQCKQHYKGRKELATEKDELIAELCDTLDDAFNYGLRQHGNFVVTAASLFQNMQEIVTGSASSTASINGDSAFWDFCQIHLTAHEKERFDKLKNVWTKAGQGKAFVRATLNENSLQRYLLTWLSDMELLRRYYTPWSLLLNEEASKQLPQLIGNLDGILFALTVDAIELNKTTRKSQAVVTKDEPIIYAPSPVPIANSKSKRKTNAIERPIATSNSTEDLLKSITLTMPTQIITETNGSAESPTNVVQTFNSIPFDPIEPELEFLKQPLPDVYPENQTILHVTNNTSTTKDKTSTDIEQDDDDKSDSSSYRSSYSKSSSTNNSANYAALEEKLREITERYAFLETRVAQLSLENRQLVRRLTRHFNESGIDPKSSFATNFLITIPNVLLINGKRATSSSYYVYEVHITMRHRLEHWSVLRRYSEFDKLHQMLLRTHPFIASVDFPPKKHFGNKNLVFVEERRQQLQIYLLNLVESLPQVEACKTKIALQKAFPFLRER